MLLAQPFEETWDLSDLEYLQERAYVCDFCSVQLLIMVVMIVKLQKKGYKYNGKQNVKLFYEIVLSNEFKEWLVISFA